MNKRIRRIRKVLNPPTIKGFIPYGGTEKSEKENPVILLYEEYEAVRLCDYDMVNHHEASVVMGVSRPTFTRIFASARQKIAKAFIEGLPISIEGGKVYFDSDWHHCSYCKCDFSNPNKTEKVEKCPLCSSSDVYNYSDDSEDLAGCSSVCVCSVCNFEQKHQKGRPCSTEKCPECGNKMYRKRNKC
ncbi:MAG: DUF134 domain-containing protein [Bacteroidales bacterium]|nr:DUF134 domain-containing protein [Bacteroidales bacterium]